MSIDNREDANKYYDIINSLIDEYIDKWKIKPTRLKRYLKPGSKRFDNFLIKNKLKDIKGSDRVLKDVINDRVAMEKDNIMTFENYKFFESEEYDVVELEHTLYKGLGKATVDMEKYLADFYDTNLSDIDIVDSDRRQFKVSAWSYKDIDVIIYSKDDMEVIKGNLIDYYYNELKDKDVVLSEDIKIKMTELINRESLEKVLLSKLDINNKIIISIISELLKSDFKQTDDSGYFLWQIRE